MTKIHGVRAVVYVRISRDRAGESLGVQRQECECRELCERSEWSVVDVLVDNDVSAYSGKRRPGYERLLGLVRAGGVDVVVAWNTDRLHRRLAELVEYTEVCARRSVTTHTVRTGPIDLSTPSGILVAQQLGAVAEYESRNRSARVRAAKDQRAASGSWSGGRRPFGWEPDGVSKVPAEATAIRAATVEVLRGGSLVGVSRRWRAAGLVTVTGKPWTAQAVRDVLLRPRNAGLRQHRGVVAGVAEWESVVTPEQWHAVRRLLTDPARRVSPGTAPKYLGAMRFRCGATLLDGVECGAPMKVSRSGKPPIQVYVCTRDPKLGVWHVTVKREPLDEHVVTELLAGMLEQGVGPADPAEESPGSGDDPAEIEAAQSALAGELAAGRLSAAAYSAANAQLAQRLADAVDARSSATVRRAGDDRLSGFDADPRGVWDSLPLDVQRELMDRYVRVTVLPAKSRSRFTAPVSERVRFDWTWIDPTE